MNNLNLPEGLNAKLDHIAITVRDLNAAMVVYMALGLKPKHRETVEEQGVIVQIMMAGETRLELLQPLSDDTPVGKFITKWGERLHHVAFQVPDIFEALNSCRQVGIKGIYPEPRIGAEGRLIMFLDPRTTGGVLIELIQDK